MPGSKIPVLEIERLALSNDGRGLIFYDDGTNAHKGAWDDTNAKFSGSADGWIKFHYISGTSYGATGAAAFVPYWKTK